MPLTLQVLRMLTTSALSSVFEKRFFSSLSGSNLVSLAEVERKFMPHIFLVEQLAKCPQTYSLSSEYVQFASHDIKCGSLRLFRLPNKLIRDQYFDSNGQLARKGIWIRRRSSQALKRTENSLFTPDRSRVDWEVKFRLRSDCINSQFVELQGKENLDALLHDYLPGTELKELGMTVDLLTRRKTWLCCDLSQAMEIEERKPTDKLNEDRIFVVLDEVTSPQSVGSDGDLFKHIVGEIQMTREVPEGDTMEAHEAAKKKAASEMQERIDAFMDKHKALFPTTSTSIGKLSAYYEWKEKSR